MSKFPLAQKALLEAASMYIGSGRFAPDALSALYNVLSKTIDITVTRPDDEKDALIAAAVLGNMLPEQDIAQNDFTADYGDQVDGILREMTSGDTTFSTDRAQVTAATAVASFAAVAQAWKSGQMNDREKDAAVIAWAAMSEEEKSFLPEINAPRLSDAYVKSKNALLDVMNSDAPAKKGRQP